VIGEHVALKKNRNPFYRTLSFSRRENPFFFRQSSEAVFSLFGCGESGDVFSFLMKYHRFEFPEALQTLAKKYGIDLPEKELSEAEKEAAAATRRSLCSQ
jgi:DNA primase